MKNVYVVNLFQTAGNREMELSWRFASAHLPIQAMKNMATHHEAGPKQLDSTMLRKLHGQLSMRNLQSSSLHAK